MRNSLSHKISKLLVLSLVTVLVSGCGPDKQSQSDLRQGYASLDAQQYDQAIAQADAYLAKRPDGEGTAEALYLRGRGLEQKAARSSAESRSNLAAARNAYSEALAHAPSPKLETLIHTGLANVAYFQDDYTTAASEWTIAYDKLDDENAKSWVLYRVGLCKQRQARFSDADQIFATVQQKYPNSVPAQRAKEHQGARGFSVQFATFGSAPAADGALAGLKRDGVAARRQNDAKGRAVVMAGPFPSYQQALSLKARYATAYPDAIILP